MYECALSFSPSFGWPPPRSHETISHGGAGPLTPLQTAPPPPATQSGAPSRAGAPAPLLDACTPLLGSGLRDQGLCHPYFPFMGAQHRWSKARNLRNVWKINEAAGLTVSYTDQTTTKELSPDLATAFKERNPDFMPEVTNANVKEVRPVMSMSNRAWQDTG